MQGAFLVAESSFLRYCEFMQKITKASLFLVLFLILLGFSDASVFAQSLPIAPSNVTRLSQDVELKIGSVTYSLPGSVLGSWIQESSSLAPDKQYLSEIELTNFCHYQKLPLCNLTFSARANYHLKKISHLSIDLAHLDSFLEDLERQSAREPINATLSMENGRVSVFSLSSPGTKLNKEASKSVLLNYLTDPSLTQPINLPYQEIQPEISSTDIDNLGVTSLIGEGRSNFRGSPKNRIFNINVATKRFNGVLIKPGEEFSFVKILGPVDGDHGYLPELVIKKDKTEPEFGGGVCQVSTTAFRAAIYSGLKITARRNHAYPVAYYSPQGMDSTIYVPRPDLRFINNTPGHILIQTKIIGTELLFQFFGTNDGRKTTIDGPRILESNPDGSMKTTFTQKVEDSQGATLINDIFNSSYDSPSKYPHPAPPEPPKTKKR